MFSGGLTYDKAGRTPSLTVIHGKTTTVLEMEHNIVDFLCLCETPFPSGKSLRIPGQLLITCFHGSAVNADFRITESLIGEFFILTLLISVRLCTLLISVRLCTTNIIMVFCYCIIVYLPKFLSVRFYFLSCSGNWGNTFKVLVEVRCLKNVLKG